MYNTEQKKAFMRDFTDRQYIVEHGYNLFESLAPYEEDWCADICTRSMEELKPVVGKFLLVRGQGNFITISILREYADWCLKNQVPGAREDLKKIDGGEIAGDRMKRRTVKAPGQLQTFLDAICEPESDETMDNIVRAYLWLAFAGLSEGDSLNVRSSDLDLRRMKIRAGGREYPIYAEAVPSLINSAELKGFHVKNKNYSRAGVGYRDRAPGDKILRNINGDPTELYMRSLVSKRTKTARDAGKDIQELSRYTVWLSGIFYRKWISELAGQPVDFIAEVKEIAGDRIYSLEKIGWTREHKYRDLALDYERDYMRWKMTF